MTMLDQNRARRQLAKKAGVDVACVTNMAIWGNHSAIMFPDFYNTRIGGRPALEIIPDEAWFKEAFLPAVQKRGAAIIEARGASSAASAANAVVDTVRALTAPTATDDCFSLAVCSEGLYGIEPGLIYSFPVRSDGRKWSVIPSVPVNEFSRARLIANENELKEERAMVGELPPR
jgi:malate dehydrogenase